jgi:hypothetical protein
LPALIHLLYVKLRFTKQSRTRSARAKSTDTAHESSKPWAEKQCCGTLTERVGRAAADLVFSLYEDPVVPITQIAAKTCKKHLHSWQNPTTISGA